MLLAAGINVQECMHQQQQLRVLALLARYHRCMVITSNATLQLALLNSTHICEQPVCDEYGFGRPRSTKLYQIAETSVLIWPTQISGNPEVSKHNQLKGIDPTHGCWAFACFAVWHQLQCSYDNAHVVHQNAKKSSQRKVNLNACGEITWHVYFVHPLPKP